MFGSVAAVARVDAGSERVAAASARARRDLLAKKDHFSKPLQPNELLIVKAPFTHEAGEEFMWVEVIEWKGSSIRGILMNEPHFIKNLRAGAEVSLKEVDLYDYLWTKPDGTSIGNETGKVIAELEKERAERDAVPRSQPRAETRPGTPQQQR